SGVEGLAAFEINASCPNTSAGGLEFGADSAVLADLVKRCRRATRRPLVVKLSPALPDIPAMAQVVKDQGGDAVSLVNTLPGALDVAEGRDALGLAKRLPDLTWVKVGPALYVREVPALVRELAARGLQVFLDFKLHDIPTTVAGAVAAARDLGAAMATVHCLGGPEMLAAARDEIGRAHV